jgi:hypothetical protein
MSVALEERMANPFLPTPCDGKFRSRPTWADSREDRCGIPHREAGRDVPTTEQYGHTHTAAEGQDVPKRVSVQNPSFP